MRQRMLLKNSIKMYGAKYFETPEPIEDPVTGAITKVKKKRCHLIKCISRLDDEKKIVVLCQDGFTAIISDVEYYELWRKQGKDLKRYDAHKRYLYFDKFFDENCRPEWCKSSIQELITPYWLNPANEPRPHFWEGAAARSGRSFTSIEEVNESMDANHSIHVDSLSVEGIF